MAQYRILHKKNRVKIDRPLNELGKYLLLPPPKHPQQQHKNLSRPYIKSMALTQISIIIQNASLLRLRLFVRKKPEKQKDLNI